jgi:alanyl-tRNA synthetase
MRRAMRHAHILGAKEPLMHRLAPTLIAEMGEAFPELKRAKPVIEAQLHEEEERAVSKWFCAYHESEQIEARRRRF